MNTAPRVSIVLPSYNGSRYLLQSVESVIAQTFQDWELIIVDDCSSDSTPDLIAELQRADPRIRSVRHETNRKLPAALNTGFALAQGEYLTWTSDDNEYLPTALETMVQALDADPAVAFVYCRFSIIDEYGNVVQARPFAAPDRLSEECDLGPCFLYRRQVYETLGGYDEEFFLAEDYDYWLRVFQRFRMEALDVDLYRYRRHPSALQTRRTEILRVTERVLTRHYPALAAIDPWLGVRNLRRRYRIARELDDMERARRYAGQIVRLFRQTQDRETGNIASAIHDEVRDDMVSRAFRAYEDDRYADALKWYIRAMRWAPALARDLGTIHVILSAIKRGLRKRLTGRPY